MEGTEREEASQKGHTPMEKSERHGGEAQRGPLSRRPPQELLESPICTSWAEHPRTQRHTEPESWGPQASCPPDPAPAPPDEVPDCPPLSGHWGSTFENLTKPTHPVPRPCHPQPPPMYKALGHPFSSHLSLCFLFPPSDPLSPPPWPVLSPGVPERLPLCPSHGHRAFVRTGEKARFLPDKQLPPVGTSP